MLILLIGEIGSGKSTVAEYLTKEKLFKEYYFSRPLKEFAKLLGFTHDQCYGSQQQKLEVNSFWGVSAREFLQKFGTEVCRDFLPTAIPNMNMNDRTLWARVAERQIKDAMEHKYNLVISDGRFEDEAKLVNEYGGVIIKLVRDLTETTPMQTKAHASETSMKNILPHYIIDNNGTLEELYTKVDKIYSQVLEECH